MIWARGGGGEGGRRVSFPWEAQQDVLLVYEARGRRWDNPAGLWGALMNWGEGG